MITHYAEHRAINGTFHFEDSQFLVFTNRLSALSLSIFVLTVTTLLSPPSKEPVLFNAPCYTYMFCALTNILSSWCQLEALKYVAFPMQVLSKACRIVPVMVMGHCLMGKKYRLPDYVVALIITMATALFFQQYSVFSEKTAEKIVPNHSMVDGSIILALFLILDAFTSNWQGYLFRTYSPGSWEMMAMVNFFSIALTTTSLVESGNMFTNLKTVISHNDLLSDCICMAIASAFGQAFVFFTIASFGPYVFVIMMTVRQVLSIILSSIIYGHYLSPLAIVSVVVIFGAIIVEAVFRMRHKFTEKRSQ